MRFSNMVTYKDKDYYVVKTGRRNIRILEPGMPYEKSFVVPLKKVSNRRPAEYEPEDDDQDDLEEDVEFTGQPRLVPPVGEDEQFLPR